MAFAESSVGKYNGLSAEESDEVEIYRVRVCTRCGHAACPCCGGTWCDQCFEGADDPSTLDGPKDDFKVNKQCADGAECVYDEPAEDAVLLLRVETKEEFETRTMGVE